MAAATSGRNTTIVRANYGLEGNSQFYSHSLKLWEGLEQELNYNVMHSQRGVVNLFHSDAQRDAFARRGNMMVNQGDDAILLDRDGCRRMMPFLDYDQTRFPIYGGLYHPRGGTARHDAVAWGYARGADRRGVDLIQKCEVTGIDVEVARSPACRPRAARSAPRRSPCAPPAGPGRWRQWRACACPSKAPSCRPS